MTIPKPWETLLWQGALRYHIGRQTYAVAEFAEALTAEWPQLSELTRAAIRLDLEREYRRHAELVAQGIEHHLPLGAACDVEQWDRVRELWA